MKFTYRTGQRPLDGYTIKRGLGQGGFGEVYFAISDAGKEVALKLIRGHHQVELRGIGHCLNLKHPNLVHLYDLRRDSQENPWLIMEFVQGESLAQVMHNHPKGLPEPLACEWFLLMAKSIGYLHDHGVVHRDLKPGNVFIENGQPKIGDYGLCKSMTESQGAAQTYNVGTVHYMAPEISNGTYNKSIDIYASGVMLYEMFTGRPPFEGESVGEILLKHMTETPDLSKVAATYRPILEKAMAKSPNRRFASMAEMASALERAIRPESQLAVTFPGQPANGTPPVPPVTQRASGESASLSTPHMGLPIQTTPGTGVPVLGMPPAHGLPPTMIPGLDAPNPMGRPLPGHDGPIVTRARPPISGSSMSTASGSSERVARPLLDVVLSLMRIPLLATVPTAAWAIWTRSLDTLELGRLYVLIVLVAAAVVIPGISWARNPAGSTLGRRVLMTFLGLVIGLGGMLLEGWTIVPNWEQLPIWNQPETWRAFLGIEPEGQAAFVKILVFFMVGLGVLRWWLAIDPRRPERFSLFPLLAAGFWSVVLSFEWPKASAPAYLLMTLPAAALVIQFAVPWQKATVKTVSRRLRLQPKPTSDSATV
ncbi:serine/threonine protein kinase [Tuwongella immobilis]|uniref:non-specific serine/threonine protein kinase n=1 Tax=Tuwongella immobilis TaxID=692036 RepID=A0A6C2YQY7_9BACT